jgi:hypothetical protein
MNLDELTIGEAKQLANLFGGSKQTDQHPWAIGEHYVIRTVTMIQTGVLVAVYPQELVLSDACWIADTGRWHDFLKSPETAKEVEPFTTQIIVGRGGIIDAQVIAKFNRTQK